MPTRGEEIKNSFFNRIVFWRSHACGRAEAQLLKCTQRRSCSRWSGRCSSRSLAITYCQRVTLRQQNQKTTLATAKSVTTINTKSNRAGPPRVNKQVDPVS